MEHLGDLNVGDVVKLNENGTTAEFIIIHKGKPSELYDDSCDGIWVMRKNTHSLRAWDGTEKSNSDNTYSGSDIDKWLTNTYLKYLDSEIADKIKTVKIPHWPSWGNDSDCKEVASGARGLARKVFLLSRNEVGFSSSPVDGAKLSYFSDNASRIKKGDDGVAKTWWLRFPSQSNDYSVYAVTTAGGSSIAAGYTSTNAVCMAFVLPADLALDPDGFVSVNALPTITSDKTGDLGTLTEGFTCNYSVNDEDEADTLSVTLSMDGAALKTFRATKETEYTYPLTGTDWLKITNGDHTFEISVTDGTDTATSTATFTRDCNKLSTTLTSPLPANDEISGCTLNVEGSIPEDAVCKYEVTNNARDDEPVWEDCTTTVKSGFSYLFINKVAENGFAFNYRVTIQRGESNTGGYITNISGGFE